MQNLNKTGSIISNGPKFLNILQRYGDFHEIKVFTELAAFFPNKDTTNYLILQYCDKNFNNSRDKSKSVDKPFDVNLVVKSIFEVDLKLNIFFALLLFLLQTVVFLTGAVLFLVQNPGDAEPVPAVKDLLSFFTVRLKLRRFLVW